MINVLKQMVEMNKEVYIVTASVESSQESKYKFIKEHMPFLIQIIYLLSIVVQNINKKVMY